LNPPSGTKTDSGLLQRGQPPRGARNRRGTKTSSRRSTTRPAGGVTVQNLGSGSASNSPKGLQIGQLGPFRVGRGFSFCLARFFLCCFIGFLKTPFPGIWEPPGPGWPVTVRKKSSDYGGLDQKHRNPGELYKKARSGTCQAGRAGRKNLVGLYYIPSAT